MSIFCKAMREGLNMDLDEIESTDTQSHDTNSTLTVEDVLHQETDMKTHLQKCFMLGQNPNINIMLYQEILEYIGMVINAKFIENTREFFDMFEFDEMMQLLITNPDRSPFLREDLINNYRFFAMVKESSKSLEAREKLFVQVIDRMFDKYLMMRKPVALVDTNANKNPTLRVGNLMTCHTREEIMGQLRIAFGKYGVIREIKVPMDYGTGNPRGYAFIEFLDGAMAEGALKATQDKLKIGPRLLRIDYALGEKRGFA